MLQTRFVLVRTNIQRQNDPYPMERNNLKDAVYVGDTQGDADACKKLMFPLFLQNMDLVMFSDAKTRIKDITDLTTLF